MCQSPEIEAECFDFCNENIVIPLIQKLKRNECNFELLIHDRLEFGYKIRINNTARPIIILHLYDFRNISVHPYKVKLKFNIEVFDILFEMDAYVESNCIWICKPIDIIRHIELITKLQDDFYDEVFEPLLETVMDN
jgi:hypothetical protein